MEFIIGICDDNPMQLDLLHRYLKDYQFGEDQCRILESTNPEEFFALAEKEQPQLVFLDIDMGESSGIELGDRLKSACRELVVVFVTAHEKYALEAFQLRAFHYLLKPLTSDRFSEVLSEALALIRRNRRDETKKTMTVQAKGEYVNIPFDKIWFFEKVGHRIKIHTEKRDVFYYDNMQNLLKQLNTSSFMQCHQGFVVNMDKVMSFRDKTLFLEGEQTVPVSRSYIEPVKSALAQKLFSGRSFL